MRDEVRRFIPLKASPPRETFTGLLTALHSADADHFRSRRGALRSLDRFEGSPRQQRPCALEPYRSATGQTPASKSLPHQAIAFGFAAETRDPLARK
jgi:hypothetical protein